LANRRPTKSVKTFDVAMARYWMAQCAETATMPIARTSTKKLMTA
jgi:hypothetical protein